MTTYNGAAFLPVQLESLRAQTRPPDELVVCDDGSTDKTIAILEAFRGTAPFDVRIVRNPENLGHERNFAQAVDLCTGDIIFLADQDDSWFPERLEVVAQAFAADQQALVIVNDVMITDGALVPTGRTVLEQMRSSGLIGVGGWGMQLGCATAFRASFRELISPIPPLEFGHDSWIHEFSAILGARRVLPQVLQLYRRHEQNASVWVFNGSQRATARQLMQPTAGQDLTPEYTKRARAFSLMRERVEALGPDGFAQLRTGGSYQRAVRRLTQAIEAVTRRAEVFRAGWFGRKLLAMRLLVRGDYRYFLGWRSFAKDLIR